MHEEWFNVAYIVSPCSLQLLFFYCIHELSTGIKR